MATPERIEELKINLENIRKDWTPGRCNLTLHDDLSTSYSDLYKSINGIRPRWVDTSEMSELEILIMMDDLVESNKTDEEWYKDWDRKNGREQVTEELPDPEWKQKLSSMRSMKG